MENINFDATLKPFSWNFDGDLSIVFHVIYRNLTILLTWINLNSEPNNPIELMLNNT